MTAIVLAIDDQIRHTPLQVATLSNCGFASDASE